MSDARREKRALGRALGKLARLTDRNRMTDEEVRRFVAHKTKQLLRRMS